MIDTITDAIRNSTLCHGCTKIVLVAISFLVGFAVGFAMYPFLGS